MGFTIFFDLEVLVKVWCMGFSTYWKRSIHKFESVLAVGSTFHLLPIFYNSVFTYFQVGLSRRAGAPLSASQSPI